MDGRDPVLAALAGREPRRDTIRSPIARRSRPGSSRPTKPSRTRLDLGRVGDLDEERRRDLSRLPAAARCRRRAPPGPCRAARSARSAASPASETGRCREFSKTSVIRGPSATRRRFFDSITRCRNSGPRELVLVEVLDVGEEREVSSSPPDLHLVIQAVGIREDLNRMFRRSSRALPDLQPGERAVGGDDVRTLTLDRVEHRADRSSSRWERIPSSCSRSRRGPCISRRSSTSRARDQLQAGRAT